MKVLKIQELMPGFLEWIHRCNNGAEAISDSTAFLPFIVDDQPVGYVEKQCVVVLAYLPPTPPSI